MNANLERPTPAESPEITTSEPARLRASWDRFRTGMMDAGRRSIYLSAIAIPGHLLMAGSKTVVLLFSFSAFMTANVLFTFGLAVIKLLVVLADRSTLRSGDPEVLYRAYRRSGAIVLVLSIAYAVSCLPLALGHNTSAHFDKNVAIAIATIAFTELGFSLHGLFASRRTNDVLMEAIKLSSLASSLILIVLTQTALLSMSPETSGDPSRYNGMCGVGLGAVAALIGVYMMVRSRARDIVVPAERTAGS